MNFAQMFFFAGLLTMANAANLRRSLVSPCSASELSENACALPDGTVGAIVCRHGFTACIHPEDHDEDDTCGMCPAPPEEPRVEPVEFPSLPLCSTVDISSFACNLADGSAGTMICHEGFSACVPEESVSDEDLCGCCFGDTTPRCQLEEESRYGIIDSVLPTQSVVCKALQMEEFACELPRNNNNSTNTTSSVVGAYVCRGGFSACIPAHEHKVATDTCGICPIVELPEDPRIEPEELELPLCSTVDLNDFACSLPSGEPGALICQNGFSACKNVNDVKDTDSCGCCPGDSSPRCLGGPLIVASKTYEP